MKRESSIAVPSRSTRPMVRARIARALRDLAGLRGWQFLVNRLVPDHSASFLILNGDTVFAGNIGSFIDRQVYLFGGYESASIRCFLARIPAGRRRTILDVGANAGTHSLAFARVFETVHAFEPNPMLWPQFERNMVLNGLTNVCLHKVGLADRDAELTLRQIDKPNYGLGTFSTVEQYDLPLRPVATCPVRHAGNYLAEIGIGSVDAVKIDVQGFEPEVLRGLADILRRDPPVIWCEIGAGTLAKIATTGELSTLIPFKFRCFQLALSSNWVGNSVGLRECSGDLPSGDYVLIPGS
jgi:FkbM family methyltransferase